MDHLAVAVVLGKIFTRNNPKILINYMNIDKI